MRFLRTPEECFESLPGYPFGPRYLEGLPGLEGARLHYLDEGNGKETFLCLHGEPTWSYLYRRMIPLFTGAGARVVAPDLAGFGKSDKPAEDTAYSFAFHRNYLLELIRRLDLRRITLVCQDWGGLLGLTLPMEMPERFNRLFVMNTALGTGDIPLPEGFLAWRAFNNAQTNLDVASLMKRACPHLTEEEAAAYGAPFPEASFKAGVRTFPALVPDHPDAPGAEVSRRARDWWRKKWAGDTFMAVGMKDPVLGPEVMDYLRLFIRNCPEPVRVDEGGHFLQEWADRFTPAALEAFGLASRG